MNKLYSILVGNMEVSGWYFKRQTPLLITDRMQEIRSVLLQDVPSEKLPMFICVLCDLVRMSAFGTEILALDNNNTYQETVRPVDVDHSDTSYCVYDVIKPATVYSKLRRYLDEDITSRLNAESWIELMGAGCLQLLREA